MPTVCTMCTHPEYQNAVRDLNAGHKHAVVSRKYSTAEHPLSQHAIRRCYVESLHHFKSKELSSAHLDYIEVEKSLAAELQKDNPDREEVQRLRKLKQALRAEMSRMKETLKLTASDGGPRLLQGQLVGISLSDPDSWPDWLPIFMLKYFDHLTEMHDRIEQQQMLRDLRGQVPTAIPLPTRKVRQEVEAVQ